MAERMQLGLTATFETDRVLDTRQTAHTHSELVQTSHYGVMLLMDGEVQLASVDEYRYHELLVHPTMYACKDSCARVLIVGGGDGCAAREVLKWKGVESVTIVDYDPEFVGQVARRVLAPINQGSLEDRRVRVLHQNAITYARNTQDERYNVIFLDLPDPDANSYGQLYLDLLYACQSILRPGGALTTHTGPLSLNPSADCWEFLYAMRCNARHVYPGAAFHFRVGYIPSFVHPWGFFTISSPHLHDHEIVSESVSRRCRVWTPQRLEHRLLASKECVSDKDIEQLYDECVRLRREEV